MLTWLLVQALAIATPAEGAGPQAVPSELAGLRGPAGKPRPVRKRAFAPSAAAVRVPVVARTGALAGKTVYLSPGHGFLYVASLSAWRTQRGNTNGLVEDFESLEGMAGYVIPYLLAAGADVVPVREVDLTAEMVIVDDADAGSYAEAGDDAAASAGPSGFGHYTAPLVGAQNPFALGQSRLLATRPTETARATFNAHVPKDGSYNVYVAYVAGADRATDAHYVIHHAGGDTHLRVNQTRHGGTWVFLGRFYFFAGQGGFVALANDAQGGAFVSADAVRLGGGLGDLADDACGCVSMRPRAEEGAVYYTQFAGAPQDVWGSGDVWSRSRMAAWVHEDGEDAVYLAWHSNAFNGTVRGTESFVYGDNPPDGSYQPRATPGSPELGMAVHGTLLAAIHRDWDPNWNDRHLQSAYFGELNPMNNPETPSVLVEVAFHDQPDDAAALREPAFRRLVARALVQGILKFFAGQAGQTPLLLPETPVGLSARQVGAGTLAIDWRPPPADPAGGDPPTGYRLYQSENGVGWDDGEVVDAPPISIAMAPGQLRFFRVAARNGAGVSLPTRAVGALMGPRERARLLLLTAFDRLDASSLTAEDDQAFALGTVQRMLLERANDGSYVRQHGDALRERPIGFDGATADAEVDLAGYEMVDWLAGRQDRIDMALATRLGSALAAGGKLLASGTDFVKSAPAMLALGATLSADDAMTRAALVAPGGIFAGLPDLTLDDGTAGTYDPKQPDVLAPAAGASADLAWAGGAAGVSTARTVVLGFPFETIVGRDARVALMGRILDHLAVAPDDLPRPLPDAGPPGSDGGADGGPAAGAAGGGCGCQLGRARGAAGRAAPGLVGLLFGLLVRARRRGAPARPRPSPCATLRGGHAAGHEPRGRGRRRRHRRRRDGLRHRPPAGRAGRGPGRRPRA